MKRKIFAIFLCLAMIAGVLSVSIYADGRDISDFEIEFETNGELPLEALAGRVLPESDRPEVVSSASVAANGHVNRLRTQETELLIQNYNEKYIAATIAKSLVEYYNLQPKL